jgi:hypothetical protein
MAWIEEGTIGSLDLAQNSRVSSRIDVSSGQGPGTMRKRNEKFRFFVNFWWVRKEPFETLSENPKRKWFRSSAGLAGTSRRTLSIRFESLIYHSPLKSKKNRSSLQRFCAMPGVIWNIYKKCNGFDMLQILIIPARRISPLLRLLGVLIRRLKPAVAMPWYFGNDLLACVF